MSLDRETIIAINDEEQKITEEGAYDDGERIARYLKKVNEFHKNQHRTIIDSILGKFNAECDELEATKPY